ncbi:hypothetical protein Y032_0191g1333 [Ancylostoma ceylanicum]|uniref:Uncharacterized protein n=1 Tax=Ancylostoma ceylanicum TaxID=53326 RepID=A0A016SQ40_9BILA|nr:hypothetical protein Y032_0191g1333 [Ancylostoma ceylanicum]
MANPALRRTEYNKERCENGDFQSYKGTRIIQTYVERGVPFEVPCYSCLRNQSGLTTVFFLISSRNFAADIDLHERREAFGDTADIAIPLSSWLLHQFKHNQSSDVSKYGAYGAQFVFGLGRAAGGHTSMEFQEILRDNTGRLQVNVVNTSFVIALARSAEDKDRTAVYEKFYGGLTLICAQLVDNEPRSLGFIHNIDYLVNPLSADDGDRFFQQAMNYEDFELLNSTSTLPFTSAPINIKIDISWEAWSCCSACCCSVKLCGLYSNEKKCHELDSYRTRRGFLSVFLLNPEKEHVK